MALSPDKSAPSDAPVSPATADAVTQVPSTADTESHATQSDAASNEDVEMESADDDSSDANTSASASDNTKSPPSQAIDPAFFAQLAAGQAVDVLCAQTKKWLPAKIELVADDKSVRVHYMGWNKSSDEDVTAHARIAPRGTHAAAAWADHDARLERRKRNREDDAAAADAAMKKLNSAAIAAAEADIEVEPTFVAVGATRSGRKVTKRIVNDVPVRRSTASQAATGVDKKAKKAAAPPPPEVFEDDLCAACGQIEDDELTDMILCDGGCLSSYHFSCLGIEEAPEGDKWLCEQCRTNEQACFLCTRNGTMNEKGGVFRCGATACGKFYHQRCINRHKLSRRFGRAAALVSGAATEDADGSESPDAADALDELETAAFRCPRHVCAVCEDMKKGSDLMYCIKCPVAYHPNCVPPSARYNSVGLLCSKHPDDKLPKIPAFYYNDPTVDAITRDLNLRLPLLFVPKTEPDASDAADCHHFRLLLNLVEDVRQKAPPYKTLGRSIYTFKKPPTESLDDAPMCVCTEQCGDDCINRLSFTECYGPAPTPGMTKFTKLTKESNCRLGDECGNRALHQKIYPRFEKFYTQDKGWGLRVLEPVKAGQLVIEYVGEVVNEDEKERRLKDHALNTPEDKNMYIMELSKGVYIDARFKGSVSRYINHACDPNCHLLKWRVKGENRIAITALKDIAAGDELSYDYQFHTQQAMEWKCHCKAPNCRGTMAPEKLTQESGGPEKKLTKKEQLQKMKRARKQEKIQQEREGKSTARRLSLTSQLCGFGDTGGKSLVRIGPAARELAWAKTNRVFLARNATRGFDFLRRKELKDRKVRAAAGSAPAKPKTESGANGKGVLSPASETDSASATEGESAALKTEASGAPAQ